MSEAAKNNRILVFYETAVGLLLPLIIGLALTWAGGGFEMSGYLRSLGSNLIASVIWAIVVACTTTWVLNRVHDQTVERAIDRQMEKYQAEVISKVSDDTRYMIEALSGWAPRYLPVVEYPPSQDSFVDVFNQDVMRAISSSKRYFFQGPSARFVAPRIEALVKIPENVKIAMTDPRSTAAVHLRARDRHSSASVYSGLKVQDIAEKLHEELIGSIVALFDLRDRCSIHVVFVDQPAVYRYEMTDDMLFLSWYHSAASQGKWMPQAMRFGRESMLYAILMLEMERRFEAVGPGYRFAANDPEDKIVEILKELGCKDANQKLVESYRRKYLSHTAKFRDYLKDAKVRNVF